MGKKTAKTKKTQAFARNKKAYAMLEILEKLETGIILTGGEVKAIRSGKANLKGGFVDLHDGRVWLNNVHISKYKYDTTEHNPLRKRELLLHQKQITKIENELKTKGITAVPLELYPKGGLIKLMIGICRGKKKWDRREELKKRSQDLDVKRALKNVL